MNTYSFDFIYRSYQTLAKFLWFKKMYQTLLNQFSLESLTVTLLSFAPIYLCYQVQLQKIMKKNNKIIYE